MKTCKTNHREIEFHCLEDNVGMYLIERLKITYTERLDDDPETLEPAMTQLIVKPYGVPLKADGTPDRRCLTGWIPFPGKPSAIYRYALGLLKPTGRDEHEHFFAAQLLIEIARAVEIEEKNAAEIRQINNSN